MGIFRKIMEKLGYIPKSEQIIRYLSDPWQRGYGVDAPSYIDNYLNQYGDAGWVYACANRIAKKASAAEMKLYAKKSNGEYEEVKQHIFLDVLESPNEAMDEVYLRFLMHLHMELAGEAFWYVVPNQVGGPSAIYPLMPNRVTVVPGTEKLIQGYIYQVGSEKVSFETNEIIHFKYPNPDPDEFFRGASPIKAARYAIATNQNAEEWNYRFFKNSARPDGYLKTDKRLDDNEVERLRRLWEKHHRGVKKSHKVAIAQQGLEYKEVGLSHKDMDFIQQLDKTRDKILAIYGVPKSILGLVEDVNRANAFQDELNFATYTINPILRFVASTLTQFLKNNYDEKLYVEFENVAPRDQELILKKHETYLKYGVYTINDVREELGKKPVPWGNRPILPLSMVPLGFSDEDSAEDQERALRQRLFDLEKYRRKKKLLS